MIYEINSINENFVYHSQFLIETFQLHNSIVCELIFLIYYVFQQDYITYSLPLSCIYMHHIHSTKNFVVSLIHQYSHFIDYDIV